MSSALPRFSQAEPPREEVRTGIARARQIDHANHSQAAQELNTSITRTLADGHARLQRSFAEIAELSVDLETDELRQPWKKFELDLMLSVDEKEPSTSWVKIWVDLASIDTGDATRDEYVRSPAFFNVERFPRAVFSSSDVRVPDGRDPLVNGRLRLNGHLADVTLEVTSRGTQIDDHGEERAIYTVTGRIDRQRFGLRWRENLDRGGLLVGDDIQIVGHLEAVRAVPRASLADA